MDLATHSRTRTRTDEQPTRPAPAVFGLRYLEEEEADIYDVVGCLIPVQTVDTGGRVRVASTGCDD